MGVTTKKRNLKIDDATTERMKFDNEPGKAATAVK